MIYTITTNPSLDYYLKLEKLNVGSLNRAISENYDAAGKGVNVSKFLDKLNINSIALGFLGGFNKDFYISLLSKYKNIQPQFTTINDNTRINIKIKEAKETALNAKGPSISDEEFLKFERRIKQIYENDYVVFSGNIQNELGDRIIEIIRDLISSGVKVILDTDNYIVDASCDYKPYLIKADHGDIGTDEKDIINKGKYYIDKGVKYFLYSSYSMPSYLFFKDHYLKCNDFKNIHDFSTGLNDAMIAGFLWTKLKGADSLEAFEYGNAVASLVSLLEEKADIDKIEDYCKKVKIERFDY